MKNMKIQKYVAELLGTFTLTLAVSLSIMAQFPLPTPVVAGMTLGLFVYTIGAISGAHINPAVTIALASIKKIKPSDAVLYIIFQIAGAALAMLVSRELMGASPEIMAVDSWKVATAEAIGAFILVFGVSSVVHENVEEDLSGIVIGSSLLLGIMLTAGLSNGVLNPAVAIGIGSVSAAYLLAPVGGALVAAWLYRWLAKG